eukprot:Gb_15712 [translate_table: standard]
MNFDFLQNLWPPKFVLTPKQDAKVETASISRAEEKSDYEKSENSKLHQDRFGIWEHFLRMNKVETDSVPKTENYSNYGKTETSKPHRDRFGIWDHIQQINLPWNTKSDKQAKKTNANELEIVESGCAIPSFTPYMAKIPWHTGARAFLSQMFPRYGNYCGPNWSSGKDRGGLLWDKKPIDWLDFCCYCHDIGYDTHDQAEMLKADIAFLECLEKIRMPPKGNPQVAEAYKSMCIAGLRKVLIPYRKQVLKQMHGRQFLVSKINGLNGRKDTVQRQ